MRRLSQAESRALTRKRLLEAAERVFAEKGFAAASLEEIAEAAGYTRGAVYYNFADKDELFIAVLEQRLQSEIATISDLIKGSDDPQQLVLALRRRRASEPRSTREARRWAQLSDEFWLYALRNESARKRLAEHQRHLRGAYASGISGVLSRLGVEPPAPVERLAALIMALDDGLARQRCLDPSELPEGLFFDLLDLLLRAAQALQQISVPDNP
jgi:AcrR family transcriptional regulator